jgi:hypothetical protein
VFREIRTHVSLSPRPEKTSICALCEFLDVSDHAIFQHKAGITSAIKQAISNLQ